MSINYKKIDHFYCCAYTQMSAVYTYIYQYIQWCVCCIYIYIYIDLLKLDSRTKLQPQRRIPEAPTRHINKFQRMILAQKLLITQYVDLGDRNRNIYYIQSMYRSAQSVCRVCRVYVECIYSVQSICRVFYGVQSVYSIFRVCKESVYIVYRVYIECSYSVQSICIVYRLYVECLYVVQSVHIEYRACLECIYRIQNIIECIYSVWNMYGVYTVYEECLYGVKSVYIVYRIYTECIHSEKSLYRVYTECIHSAQSKCRVFIYYIQYIQSVYIVYIVHRVYTAYTECIQCLLALTSLYFSMPLSIFLATSFLRCVIVACELQRMKRLCRFLKLLLMHSRHTLTCSSRRWKSDSACASITFSLSSS